MNPKTPTDELWSSYQVLFNWFNKQLFKDLLTPCVLNFSTKATVYGFFAANRWQKEQGITAHEISLNPDLLNHSIDEIASTLVRQMVHLWQYQFGMPPSKPGYHNQQWAEKMSEIGLMPSDTGKPGGRKTGFKMGHYIIEESPFAQALMAIKEMETDYFPWKGSADIQPAKTNSKLKYTCPQCGANAWGTDGLVLVCQTNDCDSVMESFSPQIEVTTILPSEEDAETK